MADVPEETVPDSPPPLEGRYANDFQIGFNAFEFVLDFGQTYDQGTLTHTRIITGPAYVKAFHDTLGASIAQYEAQFGPLDTERSG